MEVVWHDDAAVSEAVADGVECFLVTSVLAEQDFFGPLLDGRIAVGAGDHANGYRARLLAAPRVRVVSDTDALVRVGEDHRQGTADFSVGIHPERTVEGRGKDGERFPTEPG